MIALASLGLPELGGGAGILAAVVYTSQQLVAYLNNRKTAELTEETQHVAAVSAAVADAATSNSILLRTNEALHHEVGRVNAINMSLNETIREKDRRIEEMQDEITSLVQKLGTLYERLDEMKSH